jgi:FdhD protein
MNRPLLTQAARPLTFDIEAVNEHGESVPTQIAGEHPLTLYVDKREIVTLMTLGGAPEALAIGYLRNQRLIGSLDEIAAVQVDWDVNCRRCHHDPHGHSIDDSRMGKRTVTTGCGQGTIFGDLMEDIGSIRLPVEASISTKLPFTACSMQSATTNRSTSMAGAVHGCALAQGSEILMFVEDVGRHNAVDAIAGKMWLDGLDGGDKIFYTTGRLTSEMVIKTAQMGIPFLVSRSGLTQMGWEIARAARHDDDRPRPGQALPVIYRRGALFRDER